MAILGLILAACGSSTGDGAISGGGIGAAAGAGTAAVTGGNPITGGLLGGAAGAAAGGLTDEDDINLGDPIWGGLQDEGATMVEFRQGFRSMAAPTRELEKLIVSKKLAHGGNPVTRWMAANVAVAQDPTGNLKPARDKPTERSDGIVALIMAIGRAPVAQEEPQPEYQMFILR